MHSGQYFQPRRYVQALLSLLLASIGLAVAIVYVQIEYYDSDRIYSLRRVGRPYRATLLENYLRNNYEEGAILVLGDSQPHGQQVPTPYIFSTRLQVKLNRKVINAAFKDSRIPDNLYTLQYCKEQGFKFDAVIYNVNQTHIRDSDFTRIDPRNRSSLVKGIVSDFKAFYGLAFNSDPSDMPKDGLRSTRYDGYFSGINEETTAAYFEKLGQLIGLAKSVSRKVVVYITPHPDSLLKMHYESDLPALERLSDGLHQLCADQNVDCLDPDIRVDRFFLDVVHLSVDGHEAFADILHQQIGQ